MADRDEPVDAADRFLVGRHLGDAALDCVDTVAASRRGTCLRLVVADADVDPDVVVPLLRRLARVEERGPDRMLLVDRIERPAAVGVVVLVGKAG